MLKLNYLKKSIVLAAVALAFGFFRHTCRQVPILPASLSLTVSAEKIVEELPAILRDFGLMLS
jgi:hypothetical protein